MGWRQTLDHGWATLFCSRAILETKLDYAGQYTYHMTYSIRILRENGLFEVHFIKKKLLGLIHMRHFDAQYCDIAIKRLCCVLLRAYLGWTLKSMSQISQYLFIFLSQYCVPKCLVWIKPQRGIINILSTKKKFVVHIKVLGGL